jgi:hypothetical protein
MPSPRHSSSAARIRFDCYTEVETKRHGAAMEFQGRDALVNWVAADSERKASCGAVLEASQAVQREPQGRHSVAGSLPDASGDLLPPSPPAEKATAPISHCGA